LTGLAYFRAPSNLNISVVVLQVFEKNGVVSGNLEMDLKRNTTPADAGMTSMFSVRPTLNFGVIADYATSSGTLSTTSIPSGNFVRLDLTSIPSGFIGKVQIMVYA
jgi:hypothetical protein